VAVDSRYAVLTYHELDCLANQLARYLLARGAGPGDRVGLLLDQGADNYIAMLAVLKIQAAYVPLDPGFPADWIAYITADAGVDLLVSVTSLAGRLPVPGSWGGEVVFFDEAAEEIDCCDDTRLDELDHGGPVDELAYLIYTSGSIGGPKCVAISHASICNFVLVTAAVYRITEDDRVYQGLGVAFDFSVEEIWVAWMVGATVVPKPAGPSLLGHELHQFLATNRITALYCGPTLLATLGEELPELRFVLVSGEACPRDLFMRWHKPGRSMLNVYGTTEATAAATTTAVQDTAYTVRFSGDGRVTVHLTPGEYEQTSENQLHMLLID
jgi:non-ribosomal peptide synthetase component F